MHMRTVSSAICARDSLVLGGLLLVLAFVLSDVAPAAGLTESLQEGTSVEEDTVVTSPFTPPPPTTDLSPGAPSREMMTPERRRQIQQLNALDEHQRRLLRELTKVSAPDPETQLARTEDRIRQLEQKVADRDTDFDADLQRLASEPVSDRKTEERLRQRVNEVLTNRANEQEARQAELAALRVQARRLAGQRGNTPRLDPEERARIQEDLRDQVRNLEEQKRRVQAGETLPAVPATEFRTAEGSDALKRIADIERNGSLFDPDVPDTLHEQATKLRDKASQLESGQVTDSQLAPLRDKIRERGIDDPEEVARLLENGREELESQNALRAKLLRQEAQELERRIYVAGLDAQTFLAPGARFELTVTAAAHVQFWEKSTSSDTIIEYRPASITWAMQALRWPEMTRLVDDPQEGLGRLEADARRVLDPSAAQFVSEPATANFYRNALRILGSMRRVAESSLLIVRDEGVPPSASFLGTTRGQWTKTKPSNNEDIPPTRIAAQIRAPAFRLENAREYWSNSYVASNVVLIQATPETLRVFDDAQRELLRLASDTTTAEAQFINRIGKTHDRMRKLIEEQSSSASRASLSLGRAGGIYEITIDPSPFSWMPVEWNVTVVRSGGGRAAPESETRQAEGSCYPLETTGESSLGQLEIQDLIRNIKPKYLLVCAEEVVLDSAKTEAARNRIDVKRLSTGAEARRMSLQSPDGIEVVGPWQGSAHGEIVIGFVDTQNDSRPNHEYTFTWELRPITTAGSVLIGAPV